MSLLRIRALTHVAPCLPACETVRMTRFALIVLVACSCGSPKSPRSPARLAELSTSVLADLDRLAPADAVSLGHHQYDGRLPDLSAAGLAEEIATLDRDRGELEQIDASRLTAAQLEDRDTLVQELRRRLFEDVVLDRYHTNPMAYADAINLDAYISRDYAPAAARAAAVIAMCRAIPAYLAQARANLKTPIPLPWVETALKQTTGFAEFADKDIRQQLGTANHGDIGPALDACKQAFHDHGQWLEKQLATGTKDFALGTDRFLRMLSEEQGISLDLETLQRAVDEDLARNTAAITEAAHAIDPSQPVADVVAAAARDRPTPDQVLEVARQQTDELRKFIIDHKLVTIPSDDVATVRETPVFKRWNQAFLDGPGPFERKQLTSFYYISPPDPSWSIEVQHEYVSPRADLLFTTAHEVYPGHFIHGLHVRKNPSAVLRSLWFFATGEGWAHYAEEMMYDEGAGGRTPQNHIGQLKEALLRDVRFLVAIGEHTNGMTVDQAVVLFRERAFVDPGNAGQQAVRGTFDPMYLSYTLGKLIIRKLRVDWMAEHPGATLGEFHDAFLSHGAAPLPVIRRAMGITTPIL
ncbi:MAG: hypothetical protein JWO36_2738 [Myxococcales bacterium]|nr:hypothetical protein [Myxococcales bacterium]